MKIKLLEKTNTLHIMVGCVSDLERQDLIDVIREQLVYTKLVILDLKLVEKVSTKMVKNMIEFSKLLSKLKVELEVVNAAPRIKRHLNQMNAQYFFAYGAELAFDKRNEAGKKSG